jgi:chemosensory pili system protein ChpA (sensor histidine kinase/response regulator)
MPLSALFRRFRRQVERAARDEDRPLQLMLAGEGVEVDAAVVERIADPLLHLVANALTHGIEPPALRIAAGKPALGTVSLRAAAHGPFIQLEVEDDGRGLDASELRRRAVELGLRTPEQVERLTDEEAWELVFLPGLTTAPELTATAGRGIGMDVVRTAVAELSGQIRIETLPGVGTRFTLRLPVTRVVSTALKVRVGEEVFALPTLNVRRMLEVPGGLAAAPEVAVDGAPVPVHPLARLLGLAAPAARRGPVPLVVVQSLGRLFALAVDELLGIEEVVVQELGSFLGAIPGFGGVTVDPTGRVVLILDPAGLERLADHAGIASPHPVAAVAPPPAEAEGPAVLLADDSLSVRKILSRQLTAAGYRVITAQDGQGALELLREQAVAVLITDIEMPRMNGFELLDAVRRRPESRNLPVVVVTTRSGAKHQDLAASLGSTAYLTKPVDIGELTAVLARWTAPPRRAAAQG